MRSFALLALLLTLAVSPKTYAQYGFEDFMKAVESGQQKNAAHNSPRLAQLPSGPEELPTPQPNPPAPSAAGPESGLSSPSDQAAVPSPVPLQPLPQTPATGLSMPDLPQINFEEAFAMQDAGLSVGCGANAPGGYALPTQNCDGLNARGCSHSSCASGRCGAQGCTVMAHYPVNLPPPSTLHGYFNASPCIANVWDGYACDAAKECQRTQRHLQGEPRSAHAIPAHKTRCE